MKFIMDDIFMHLSGRDIAGRYFMLPLPLILLLRILLGNRTNVLGNSLALRSPFFSSIAAAAYQISSLNEFFAFNSRIGDQISLLEVNMILHKHFVNSAPKFVLNSFNPS